MTYRSSCGSATCKIAGLYVSQPIVARVMSKRKQGENELKTSEATFAQSTATSEANSVNSGNSLSVRTERHTFGAPLSKDSFEGREEKGSGEEAELSEAPSLSRIFREARERFGGGAAAIIGKALRDGLSHAEVWEEIENASAIEGADVRDLAYALWRP